MHFKHATIWSIVIKETFTNDRGLVIVDLIFTDNEIYREALADVIQLQIDEVIILVVTPENLIKIKKFSNRPQDWVDIQALEEAMAFNEKKIG